jgi:hypothetical protein
MTSRVTGRELNGFIAKRLLGLEPGRTSPGRF